MFKSSSLPKTFLKGAGLSLLWLLVSTTSLYAQTSVSGWTPPGKQETEARQRLSLQEKAAIGEAPRSLRHPEIRVEAARLHRLSPIDTGRMRLRESGAGLRKRLRIGVVRSFPRPLGALADASAYRVAEGNLFIARVMSEGALHIRMRFTNVDLPEGARLFIYSRKNAGEFHGPYQGRGPAGDGVIWAPPGAGDEIVVEYFEPEAVASRQNRKEPFLIAEVGHIFRSLNAGAVERQNDQPGPCNLEAPPAWRESAKSVALLTIPSKGFIYSCTGTLLNTANNSGVPYLLTANHCLSRRDEANSLSVTWFKDSTDTSTLKYNHGADLIATGLAGDFTLLKLQQPAAAGVRFSGWTAERPDLSTPVAGIHHPLASYKRIAFGSVVTGGCPPGIPAEICEGLQWVRWNSGVTEPGSSGSGLFAGDPSDPKLAGALTGGSSACDNQSGLDFYGRFDLAFQAVGYYLTGTGCAYKPDSFEKLIGSNGGEGNVRLDLASDGSSCPWTAATNDSWLRITSNANGGGGATITFAADANPNPGPRTGFLKIAGQLIAVTQAGTGAACSRLETVASGAFFPQKELSAGDCRSTLIAGAYADRYVIEAQAGQQISLELFSNDFAPFAAIFAPGGALLAWSEYGRPGTITFPASGAYIIEATSNDPDETGSYGMAIRKRCDCSLSSGRKNFDATGGAGEFTVNAPPDCSWRVEYKPDWITINSGSSGVGVGKVIFTVAPLPAVNQQRKGDIRILLEDFTSSNNRLFFSDIVQSTACSYSFDSFSEDIGNLGSASNIFNLRTGDHCVWTPQSDRPWLSFEIPDNGVGVGSGYLRYKVEFANMAPGARTATITVGDLQHKVVQPGIGAGCQIMPLSIGQTVSRALDQNCIRPSTGGIDPDYKGAYHSFTGAAGQRIAVSSSSSTMFVEMYLIGPDSKVIAQAPHPLYGIRASAQIPETGFLTLPATGTYIVALSGLEKSELFTRYTLSVSGQRGTNCVFALSAGEYFLPPEGGDGAVQLTQSSGTGCDWSAASNESWLTVFSGASGGGNGEIKFRAVKNTGGARTGYLTIAGRHFKVIQPQAISMAAVSAASYGPRVTPDSIVALFGVDLAARTEVATELPLPETLAGTSVRLIRDNFLSATRLFFVSPSQINFLIPSEAPRDGNEITIEARRSDGYTALTKVRIDRVAPALFSADATGQGAASALALRVRDDGSQVYESVVERNASGQWVAKPIDLGADNEQVYLILFGSGIRNAYIPSEVSVAVGAQNLPVTYAGFAPGFVGLDQVNTHLPKTLRGAGELSVAVTVEGIKSNTVKINIK